MMSLVQIASHLFPSFNKASEAAKVGAAPVSLPVSSPAPVSEWVDDAPLRRLADEYRAGRTKWIFASDLSEFYQKFDGSPAARGTSIEMKRDIADWLTGLLDKGLHIERPDNDIYMAIGPMRVPDMRVAAQGRAIADFRYVYNAVESYFEFTYRDSGNNIRNRKFQFGMDFNDMAGEWPAAPARLGAPRP